MRKYLIYLMLLLTLLSVAACGSEEIGGSLATPTAIVMYTPVAVVAESADDEAEAVEAEVVEAEPVEAATEPAETEHEASAEPTLTPEVLSTPEPDSTSTVEIHAPMVTTSDTVTDAVVVTDAVAITEAVTVTEVMTDTVEPPVTTEVEVESEEAESGGIQLVMPRIIIPVPRAEATVLPVETVSLDAETATPEATATAEPTMTPEPTATIAPTQAATDTPEPTATVEVVDTPEPVAAESEDEEAAAPTDLPEAFAAALAEADPENGAELVVSTGCIACHSLDEGVKLVGPSWYHLADHAAEHVEGQSATLYLYESIVAPNAYVVEDYQPNLMPQNYQDLLGIEKIADIVAYLLTLKSDAGGHQH